MSRRSANSSGGAPPEEPRLWVSRPQEGFHAIACPLGIGVDAATFALERIGTVQPFASVPAGNVENPRVAAMRRSILETDAAWRAMCRADSALDAAGATLAAVSLADERAVVAHLGDCRIYQLREWRVIRETVDHVQEATRRPSSIAVRALVRAFGMDSNPEVNLWDVEPGDLFALSAGVHDFVSTVEMVSVLRGQSNLVAAVSELVGLARERGALDHYGIVLVRSGKDGAT